MTYISHADLGGKENEKAIVAEPEGEVFHASWEAKTLALTLAMGGTGLWNIDMTRSARETLPGYVDLSYYEIWYHGLCKLVVERGLASDDEIAAGRSLRPAVTIRRTLRAENVPAVLASGAPTERRIERAPRFTAGDRVRTRAEPAEHHTRLPGYARGKQGVIDRVIGPHVFADAHAQGQGEAPQWLYTVLFEARELWGDEAGAQRSAISIDAWESYLQPV